jgi:hypothetical protein
MTKKDHDKSLYRDAIIAAGKLRESLEVQTGCSYSKSADFAYGEAS